MSLGESLLLIGLNTVVMMVLPLGLAALERTALSPPQERPRDAEVPTTTEITTTTEPAIAAGAHRSAAA